MVESKLIWKTDKCHLTQIIDFFLKIAGEIELENKDIKNKLFKKKGRSKFT